MKPHLLHVFSTFAPGGPQVRTVQLIEALRPEFRHSIVAMDGDTRAHSLFESDDDVRLVPSPPKSGTLRTVSSLRALFREVRPDLLCTYNWGAIEAVLANVVRRIPACLHHEDGFRPDELGGFKARRTWTRRLALPGVQGIVVPSQNLARIARDIWRQPEARVHWVPNGILPERFPPRDGGRELRRELGLPEDAFVIGYCGHLRGEKNPVRFIEALGAMQSEKACALMLGDGPQRPAVEAAIDRLGLADRVVLAGHVEDPRAHYRAMDAFCLSSDTEQMPVAQLEAMATGLPVCSTDVGDVARMLPSSSDAAALVVPLTGGAPALALALDRLDHDRALARRLGDANRDHVTATFAFATMVERYRELYHAALAHGARRASVG